MTKKNMLTCLSWTDYLSETSFVIVQTNAYSIITYIITPSLVSFEWCAVSVFVILCVFFFLPDPLFMLKELDD